MSEKNMSVDEARKFPSREAMVEQFVNRDGLGAQFVEGPVYCAVVDTLAALLDENERLRGQRMRADALARRLSEAEDALVGVNAERAHAAELLQKLQELAASWVNGTYYSCARPREIAEECAEELRALLNTEGRSDGRGG